MSLFAVVKSKIKEIKVHSNADKLELGTIENNTYQFVVGKGEFKTGDDVIYFPIDSLLLDELSIYLNVRSFLTGKEHNRIRTVKLRGEISQGLVVPAMKIYQYLQIKNINVDDNLVDYKDVLQVVKYEPPPILEKGGKLIMLPEFVESYDIEGCDNFPDIVNYLMDKVVMVSEKLEGSNAGVTITPEGQIIVNQHNYAIEPIEGQVHTWIKVSEECGVVDFVKKLQQNEYPQKQITVRTELLGGKIQSNIYKFKEYTLRIYDIKVDGKYIGYKTYKDLLVKYDMIKYNVPILSDSIILKEWLNGKTIQGASNGKSILNPEVLREGIVIKPIEEEYVKIGKFQGRLIIKQRSPEYLCKDQN